MLISHLQMVGPANLQAQEAGHMAIHPIQTAKDKPIPCDQTTPCNHKTIAKMQRIDVAREGRANFPSSATIEDG